MVKFYLSIFFTLALTSRLLALTPNDPEYPNQWALPKIQAELGWDLTTGSQTVVVAVVDTGVDWNHPDLAANIWVNADEIPGNSIDDDNNGYVDDVRGWDFVDDTTGRAFAIGEDLGPADNDPMDFYGHGTMMAGVIAAVGNNGLGVSGLTWNCKIMPLRVGIAERDTGKPYITEDWEAKAIRYAADNGAKVIYFPGNDLNWPGLIKDAIDYAYAKGALVVAGAGNHDESLPGYPAAYSKVIGVAATDVNDERSVWGTPQPPLYQGTASDYGTWISVAAPGSSILTTAFNDTYATANGTSLSAAFVSGLAALILSRNPSFGPDDIKKIIASTTDRISSNKYLGTGRININKALRMSAVSTAVITSPVMDQTIGANIAITGSASGSGFVSYTLQYGQGLYPASWTTITTSTLQVTDGTLGSWDISAITDNLPYTMRLSVLDSQGNRTIFEVIVYIQKAVVPGWPKVVEGLVIIGNGIAIGDLDKDNDFELVAMVRRNLGGPNTTHDIYVLNPDGSTTMGRWPVKGINRYCGAPAVADVVGDKDLEIIAGGYNWGFPNSTTKFHVFDRNGNYVTGWPKQIVSPEGIVSSTPSIGDLDNDTKNEIVFTSQNSSKGRTAYIYIYRGDGSLLPGWPKTIDLQFPPASGGIEQASHACLVDLDKDGDLEIIVGLGFYTSAQLHVYHHDGSVVSGWPKVLLNNNIPSPVAGDIDKDGNIEVVATNGNGSVYVWRRDGTVYPGWPMSIGSGLTEPSLGDLDGDGDLEIIFHANDDKVYAYHHNGLRLQGWPVNVEARIGNSEWPAPLIADINVDNQPDVIQASGDEARIYAWQRNGSAVPGWPKNIPASSSLAPAIWDINGDGRLEMALAYQTTLDLWNLDVPFERLWLQWPMSYFNSERTAAYLSPDGTPPAVNILEPLTGTVVRGTTVIKAAATDSSGIYGVRFYLDSLALAEWNLQSPYNLIWDTRYTANGAYALTAIARDKFGNEAVSSPVNITVNNIPGDLDSDSVAGCFNDFILFGANYGLTTGFNPQADMDKDQDVDIDDFILFGQIWQGC